MNLKDQVLNLIDTNLPDLPPSKIRSASHREVEKKIVEYASNAFRIVIPNDGLTITDGRLIDRNVAMVVINDYTKNKGWVKPLESDTIEFTDDTNMLVGDIITIILE